MKSFKTHIEIPVTVFYDFSPAERMTQSYPGHPAYVSVNAIEYEGIALPSCLLEGYSEELEQECWEDLEKRGEG